MRKSLPNTFKKYYQQGFTLVELAVVVGVLSILLAIVLVAINPARQFSQANNTQRRSDVNAILNAVHQYAADNSGVLPAGITSPARNIGSGGTDSDICSDLVTTYIAEMPVDPTATGASYTNCSSYNTGYTIEVSSIDDRITVAAPYAELSETISVTR